MATSVQKLASPPAEASCLDADSVIRARRALVDTSRFSLSQRLAVIERARHLIAGNCHELAATIHGIAGASRNLADTLVAEVLPLAEAFQFLERQARKILRPAKLGRKGRPFWLSGVGAEVHRVPFGVVLIIAPSNYPLFLPGVQCVQALAAGNAVLWKPASGGSHAARALARVLAQAGLPDGLLQILDETPQAGIDAIRAGVDKVFVTGHADTGRAIMHELAETRTPSVMELSGCDAVFVLQGADLERVAAALAFGMRLNGSATCMAPRRIFATASIVKELSERLLPAFAGIDRVPVSRNVRTLLDEVLLDAQRRGATIEREGRLDASLNLAPTMVVNVPQDAAILRTDIFAPVLAFCAVPSQAAALAANDVCPYALTASIFGNEQDARDLSAKLRAGTVIINDLIVSTADPRISFGGRGASGFGVTRGREGLLEMTAIKTILVQTRRSLRPYAATTDKHETFFASYIEAMHSGSFGARLRGFRKLFASAKKVEND